MLNKSHISIKNDIIKENASEQDATSSQNFDSLLKKRNRPTSYSELTKIVQGGEAESQSDSTQQLSSEQDKRQRRLLQNRLSAKKCRQKKKQEFNGMQYDVENLIADNKSLKEKINDITMMLYQKIDENALMQRKLDQAVMQNTVILSQLLNVPQAAAASPKQSSGFAQVLPNNSATSNSNLLGNLNGFQKMNSFTAGAQQNQNHHQQSQILSLLSSLQGSDAQKKQLQPTTSPKLVAGVTKIPVQVIQQNNSQGTKTSVSITEAQSPVLSMASNPGKAVRNNSGSGDQLSESTNADQNVPVKF